MTEQSTSDDIVSRIKRAEDKTQFVIKIGDDELKKEAQEIMELKRDKIESMTVNQSKAAAYVLRQYLVYVTCEIRKLDVVIKASEDAINAAHARNMDEFKKSFFSKEVQRAWVIQNDPLAMSANGYLQKAYERKLMSGYILDQVEKMAELLGSRRYDS